MGRLRFCSLLEFHLRDILSSCLLNYVCGLFKMVFDCLWVVIEFFEVVVLIYLRSSSKRETDVLEITTFSLHLICCSVQD